MVDIEKLKPKIVEQLKPLNPEKIILFGSYAYGNPNNQSDIDLFIVKDIEKEKAREYKINVRKQLRGLITDNKIGFDILVASDDFIKSRDDYFYKVDILQNGKLIYE